MAPYQISFGWNSQLPGNAPAYGTGSSYQPGPWFIGTTPTTVEYPMYMGDNIESNHGGGSVVTFCDSHTIFLRNDITYTVYEQLCNSNDIGIPINSPYYSGNAASNIPACTNPPLDEINYSN